MYNGSKISLEWLQRVFNPQTREQANQKPRVLICDGFVAHKTVEAQEFCFENNIILCRLPSHTSHKLQPCDVGVFAPLKTYYREGAEQLCQAGIKVGKEDFTSVYSPAREKAFTKRNITAAWAACGLFPLNPERVLRHTPKPLAQLTLPKADELRAGSCPQDEVVQTPVTPVSADALTSLHNLIEQDACMLDGDGTGVQRLRRHVRKLVHATKTSFAERDLYLDRYQSAMNKHSEAKVRRSTKSLKLGPGKVMSFEELEEARAARAAKEVINGRGKLGRKRKSEPEPEPEPEAESEPEPEPEVVQGVAPVPWRAPVARMI